MLKTVARVSFLLLLICSGKVMAQFEKGRFIVPATVIGKDTIPDIKLQTVEIIGYLSPKDLERIQQYSRLRSKVIKVWPYAQFAASKFQEINDKSLGMKPKERRRYIKDEEKKAKEQYEKQLRAMTFSEGKILIKLVDRQTGNSSYALVKELKGSMNAFFWQSIARLFGTSLKLEYDPLGEDKQIEQIVQELEAAKRNQSQQGAVPQNPNPMR